ncbi:hypothetical protein O3G_MSEX009375 [Manduca sexta]|uniref:Uncharacterized protein n=1 Tax=Manduca sexta TaxID=7130 RepID=A0A921ZDR1_MANSE|nr:hypothetical protein O3G_MSEX009375 [Manduca sexta]KAG6455753.1 hypothetical protein O3G_MSEX009375 [Manduca sexta]KAG6455754.1 hypothetical protein O3G_MSEX009375 [Manduca sexta]
MICQTTSEQEISIRRIKESEETTYDKNSGKSLGKRSWDRRNACFYCQEVVTNFSRHLLRHHANEIEVLKYQNINDADPKIRKQKRQAITDKLRNQGNFIHNSKVSFDRDGESSLLPIKRNNNQGTSSPSSYATCKICLGTFKRTTFFRHFKKCNNNDDANKLPSLKRKSLYNNSITIIPNTTNTSGELRDKILSHLRSDEISLVIKNDSLITAYGARLLKKKKELRSRKQICSKMRDLATLLTMMRKKDSTIENLTDAIEPEKYDTFIDSIKAMCGYDKTTGTVNITSIPARLRPAILGCIDILYTQCIMSTESAAYKESYKKKLDDFKRLIEINWQWEISSNAEKSRKRANMMKENVIPLDDDIATVMRQIQKLEIKYNEKLRRNRDPLNYESLCIVTIAHIIMLDRKRAGDVAQAELTFYINRKNEEVPEKVLETLTLEQRKSIEDLDIFQIPGKRTRAVPILLTKLMRENIDLIIACREDLNIPSSNKYLFARPGTEEPFDGGKCLDKIKKQCNLKRPEMLTSTGMRHHIATMSQVHAKQNDQYTEHLAGFLGHDVAVHAKNYRLPMQVLQKAIVGTQLIEYENTLTERRPNETKTTLHSDLVMDERDNNDKTLKMLPDSELLRGLPVTPNNTNETPESTLSSSTIAETETKIDKVQENINYQRPKTKQTRLIKVKPNIRKSYTKHQINSSSNASDEEILVQKKYRTRQIKNNPKVRKENKKQTSDLSSTESDEGKPVQKRNKINHRKWSEEEIKVVKKYFQTYINKKKNPGKSKCMEVLNKEPALQNRTWMQINTYVNNIYKKK